MGERILVPFDGSLLSHRALERAVTEHSDAEITILHVVDPLYAIYEAETEGLPGARRWQEEMEERAEELCAEAEKEVAEYECVATTAIRTGRPAHEILEYARDHKIEHIIMGSHGRSGASRLVLGSGAERVMRQSPVPVTIVR